MTASNALDWAVAMLVCWASLIAILGPSREASQCDVPYATSGVSRAPPATLTRAEIEAMIVDMKRHD